VLSTRFAAQGNADEQSDAPKSANGAFSKWRDHRADLVIRSVRQAGRTRTQCNGTRTRTRKDRDDRTDFRS